MNLEIFEVLKNRVTQKTNAKRNEINDDDDDDDEIGSGIIRL